jgi:hypothetical protein
MILSDAAGHRVNGLLPSAGFQEAVLSAYGKLPKGNGSAVKPAAPLIRSSLSTGCPNTFAGPFPNIRANQICDLRRQAEQQIAINPADPSNLAVGQNDSRLGYNRQGVDYSIDGGAHWGDYQPPTTQVGTSVCVNASCQWTYDAVSDPALAFGSNGSFYYALLGFDFLNDANTGLWMLRSNAGLKASFLHSPDTADLGSFDEYANSPVGLIHDNFGNPFQSDDKEFIAVDPNDPNHVVITWTIFESNNSSPYTQSPIFFSQSFDGGATWNGGGINTPGAPTKISGTNPAICRFGNLFDPSKDPNDCNFDQGSWPIVGEDGTIYVVFNNSNVTKAAAEGKPGIAQQLFVKSVDGGAHWSRPVRVSLDYATEPVSGFHNPGLPNGCPFGRQCLPPNGYRMNNFPSMGLNATGKLVVYWSDFRNGSYPTNANEDVFASISNDGGANWNAPTKVTNSADTAAQYFPWGSLGKKGNLYVMYYDRRYGSCESSGCLDVTLATSTDNGAHWTHTRITTGSMPNLTPVNNPFQQGFIGDYNSLTIGGGKVWMAWADTRGLGGAVEEDVYVASHGLVKGDSAPLG